MDGALRLFQSLPAGSVVRVAFCPPAVNPSGDTAGAQCDTSPALLVPEDATRWLCMRSFSNAGADHIRVDCAGRSEKFQLGRLGGALPAPMASDRVIGGGSYPPEEPH